MKLILFFLIGISSTAFASDFFLIEMPLPNDMKSVSNFERLPENKFEYDTPLGVSSRCYLGSHYLIVSRNEYGSGYELTEEKPVDAVCVSLNSQFGEIQNKMRVKLGIERDEIAKLLNAPITSKTSNGTPNKTSNEVTLLYNQKIIKDGTEFDEQSWVDIKFNKNYRYSSH